MCSKEGFSTFHVALQGSVSVAWHSLMFGVFFASGSSRVLTGFQRGPWCNSSPGYSETRKYSVTSTPAGITLFSTSTSKNGSQYLSGNRSAVRVCKWHLGMLRRYQVSSCFDYLLAFGGQLVSNEKKEQTKNCQELSTQGWNFQEMVKRCRESVVMFLFWCWLCKSLWGKVRQERGRGKKRLQWLCFSSFFYTILG